MIYFIFMPYINLFILYYRVAGIYDARLIPLYRFTSSNLNYISLHDRIQYSHAFYIRVEEIRDPVAKEENRNRRGIIRVLFTSVFRSYANRRHLWGAFKFAPSGLILRKRAGLTNDEGLHTKRSIPRFLRARFSYCSQSRFDLSFSYSSPPPLPALPTIPFSSVTSERISFKIL